MDEQQFLRDFSASLGVTPLPENFMYIDHIKQSIDEKTKLIQEMDGGAGKTIGYLIPLLFKAEKTNGAVIVATSTISNRDQIVDDFDKIQKFAKTINHPIANIPLINYRSIRDYCNISRVENLLDRLRNIGAPNSVISELEIILSDIKNADPKKRKVLIDDILPQPITAVVRNKFNKVSENIFVDRDDLRFGLADHQPDNIKQERLQQRIQGEWHKGDTLSKLEGSRIIVTTHAMLAKNRTLRDMIQTVQAEAVVMDEADRLLSLDFLSNIDISVSDIMKSIRILDDLGFDVKEAKKAADIFNKDLKAVKPYATKSMVSVVMLKRETLPDSICDPVIDSLKQLIEKFKKLIDEFNHESPDIEYGDLQAEREDRIFEYDLDEIIGNMELFAEQFTPNVSSEFSRLKEDADVRLFVKWGLTENDVSMHIVTISPGRSMKWLFTEGVPVILTTALVGTEHRRFCTEIGLWKPSPLSGEIRIRNYGHMKFTYVTGMPPHLQDAQVNSEFTSAVSSEIRSIYKPGSRMLVLVPSYRDIDLISQELIDLPILAQQRSGNIVDLRKRFISDSGISLTVLWEGYNITAPSSEKPREDGRRGLIDTIVITRLPFPQPNEMVKLGLRSIYGQHAEQWIWDKQIYEVMRKVYQGICRGLRGPKDKCEVFFMDARFPPPLALLQQNPIIQTKPGHKLLIRAIPERFVHKGRNFSWRKHG